MSIYFRFPSQKKRKRNYSASCSRPGILAPRLAAKVRISFFGRLQINRCVFRCHLLHNAPFPTSLKNGQSGSQKNHAWIDPAIPTTSGQRNNEMKSRTAPIVHPLKNFFCPDPHLGLKLIEPVFRFLDNFCHFIAFSATMPTH